MFRKYCDNPVYVTLDIHNQIGDVPAKAYITQELINKVGPLTLNNQQNGKEGERMFRQLNVRIEGLPIEEAGVEHVLRGIRDASVVSIYNQVTSHSPCQQINDKVVSLRGIEDRLRTCIEYLNSCSETNPPNPEILNQIQSIVNVLPNLHVRDSFRCYWQLDEIQEAMTAKTNDIYMLLFLSSLVRTVVSLHDLVKVKEDSLSKNTQLSEEKKEQACLLNKYK